MRLGSCFIGAIDEAVGENVQNTVALPRSHRPDTKLLVLFAIYICKRPFSHFVPPEFFQAGPAYFCKAQPDCQVSFRLIFSSAAPRFCGFRRFLSVVNSSFSELTVNFFALY